MKTSTAILIGTILLFSSFLISIIAIEKGDINTIGLYLVIFTIPVIILGFLNGFILDFAKKRKRIMEQRIWSFVPLLTLTILILLDLRLFDANMSFLGTLGLIAFGITNLIWNMKLKKHNG